MRWITPDRLQAIRQLRCPRCLQGPTFRGWITMHETCSHCGLLYNREQGFFLGALYLSYGMGIPILLVSMGLTAFALKRNFSDSFWHALILFVPVTPWIFRYSRVIWMHIVQHLDPLRTR